MQVPSPKLTSDGNVVPMPRPEVPKVYLAMAAAAMHAEGRLYTPPKMGTAEDLKTREKVMETDQLIMDEKYLPLDDERVRPATKGES